MTSYEFEVAAKNAVIEALHEQYGIEVVIGDLHLVWFSHIVGHKKCLLRSEKAEGIVAEVTWAYDSQTLYVDLYKKCRSTMIPGFAVDSAAHV